MPPDPLCVLMTQDVHRDPYALLLQNATKNASNGGGFTGENRLLSRSNRLELSSQIGSSVLR